MLKRRNNLHQGVVRRIGNKNGSSVLTYAGYCAHILFEWDQKNEEPSRAYNRKIWDTFSKLDEMLEDVQRRRFMLCGDDTIRRRKAMKSPIGSGFDFTIVIAERVLLNCVLISLQMAAPTSANLIMKTHLRMHSQVVSISYAELTRMEAEADVQWDNYDSEIIVYPVFVNKDATGFCIAVVRRDPHAATTSLRPSKKSWNQNV